MKVLICEDNVVAAMFYEDVLREAGHHVLGLVPSARAALEKCAERRPDLVLVDLRLNDGPTGATLVEVLDTLGIPSIVVSANIEALPDRTSARAVLAKPVDERQLLSAVACLGAESIR